MSAAAGEPDLLASFVAEIRHAVEARFLAIGATEIRCWFGPLHDSRRALQEAQRFREGTVDAATLDQAADQVRCLRVPDHRWPLPVLLGSAALDLETLLGLAVQELRGRADGRSDTLLDRFREIYREATRDALDEILQRATTDLTALVRALQAWQMTLNLASVDGVVRGESSEVEDERARLIQVLEDVSDLSWADELRMALDTALDIASAQAREAETEHEGIGIRASARRRWSQSQSAALSLLRRRREGELYARVEGWARHHEGLWARIELQAELLSLNARTRSRLEAGLSGLESEVVAPVRAHLGAAIATLHRTRAEARTWGEGAGAKDWSAGVDRVEDHHGTAMSAVREALEALDGLPLAETATDLSDRCVGDCLDALGDVPTRLETVEWPPTDSGEWPLALRATLTPREWASRVFRVGRMSAIRSALLQVAGAAREGVDQAHRAPDVLAYTLEAALDEIRFAAETGEASEDPWMLVADGTDRTAGFLERIVEAVEGAHVAASRTARSEIDAATVELLERLADEDRWTAELGDAWSDGLDHAKELARGVQSGSTRAWLVSGRASAFAFQRARNALEGARRMIRGGASPTASDETLRELSAFDAKAGSLPFVYRRLFSPRSVTDPSLFVGREEEIVGVLRHWNDWRAGRTNTLVVTAPSGGGMRSLMTAAAAASDHPGLWVRVSLDTRIGDEAGLAELLARALFEPEEAQRIETFEGLTAALRTLDGPRVIHVGHLEYAFLRTVDGFRLVEKALEFFSYTDSLVAWLITMPFDAWRVLTTVSPSAASLSRTLSVGPLDSAGLKAMLVARHQRSGLALRFDEGSVPAAALRGVDGPVELENAFYTRFWELTDGSAPLALLYWIRSAAYEHEAEHVTIRWPEPLDFAFLEDLSWDQAFALQAFTEHGILEVEEHARVFSTSSDRSYEILESLGNLFLIEPAGAMGRGDDQLTFSSVDRGVRYRVRPVLQPLVRRLLKERHLTT